MINQLDTNSASLFFSLECGWSLAFNLHHVIEDFYNKQGYEVCPSYRKGETQINSFV